LIVPLSSEYETYKTVKVRFWPWRSGRRPCNLLSCSHFARQRTWSEPTGTYKTAKDNIRQSSRHITYKTVISLGSGRTNAKHTVLQVVFQVRKNPWRPSEGAWFGRFGREVREGGSGGKEVREGGRERGREGWMDGGRDPCESGEDREVVLLDQYMRRLRTFNQQLVRSWRSKARAIDPSLICT
jgi:hypothetical protein